MKIRGSLQKAKELAVKHGFIYDKHLFEDYHTLKRPELNHRLEGKSFLSEDIDKKLDMDPKVEWFMQQKERKYKSFSDRTFRDPFYSQQWYIRRADGPTYNITSVWKKYTGRGILVAVVDDGVDGNHPELSDNYNATASFDFVEGDRIPVPSGRTVSG